MKILVTMSRILVGALFIVSGLIKANDTLGFSYKLEEYFENGALAYRIRDWFGWDTFSLEFLMEYALGIAIIMCAAEVILGFMLLFATKIKLTLYSLLALTIMFFFLTLHTATCDTSATYTNLTEVQVNSPEHARMIERAEADSKIVIAEETNEIVVYKEEMAVQCVTDCGCFGDAMKGSLGRSLTPWESFFKDFVLIVLLIPIFFYRNKIKLNTTQDDIILLSGGMVGVILLSWVFGWYFPVLFTLIGFGAYYAIKKFFKKEVNQWIIIALVTLITLIFINYTYNHLPVKDYRPYAIGKSIPDQMKLPEGAKPDVFENIFYYKNKTTGKVEEFTEANYPWDDENYEFSDRTTKLISIGDKAAITDFTIIGADEYDYTQDYMNDPGYLFMMVAYDIRKTDDQAIKKINTFADQCFKDGHYFIGLTASSHDNVEVFKGKHQVNYDFYSCDAITLKTIVRANPGIVLLQQGKVLAKWHANDLPNYEDVKNQILTK